VQRPRRRISQRKKIAARAAELVAEEMTLQELRRVRKVTQVRIAKELAIRLEKRSDLLLSTLSPLTGRKPLAFRRRLQ
jgi:hypothetical protein